MSATEPSVDQGFGSLFTFLPIGAYRCAPDGTMLHANPALVRLNGFATEAAFMDDVNRLADNWYIDPGRRRQFQSLLASEGQVRGFVSEVRQHGTGLRRWVSENAHMVRDAQGRALYYEGTVEDITEQVLSRQALEQSERQLRLIASQVPGMVFAVHVGVDGRRQYRYVSSGARDIYGVEPEDLMRDPELAASFRHPEDRGKFLEDIERIGLGPVELSGEFRIMLPDGCVKWLMRRSCTVSSDDAGSLRVGVLIDVTEHREAQAALRRSDELWKLALESAGDGVWDWNLQTDEEYLSTSIKAMYGFADDELPNLRSALDSRTHPDDLEAMRRDREAHLAGLTPIYRNEHRVRCKNGEWKWVLSRGMVISRDAQGKALRIVGTHTDVTELRQAEERRRLLEAQLRESQKMEAIGTLAGGVAHDFNNLLAAILGNVALAREDVAAGHPAQESLVEVQRAALRARQLVQQILTFSRRQAQAMVLQPLTPLVEEALSLMRSLLPAGVRLSTRLGDAGLSVMADSTQIQQVVMNLCTNAWQAMQGRSGHITVGLRLHEQPQPRTLAVGGHLPAGRYACLSVADDGRGIDPGDLGRIFEPFFTTKPPGEGTGLGLSVVHGIVSAHQGVIDVRSRPGEGTRFDVYLPLPAAQEAAVPGDAGDGPAGQAAPPAAVRRQPHVVYVDDYEAMLFLAARLLTKQGYQVSTFASGEAALAWLRQHEGVVDLLVTDHNMPGMSGVDLAREVKALLPGLRVAIMSGYVNDELRAQARQLGVHDVLAKQDSIDDMAEAVRGLLA